MKSRTSAFTLVELLTSITIIAMLIGLMVPQVGKFMDKAKSTKCMSNLRQIGTAANLYANDNDGRFPMIESMPSNEVYTDPSINAKPLFETLEPYGLTQASLRCPSDIGGPNFFAKEGSSYQWRNMIDDELASAPKTYGRRGVRVMRSAWLVIATDFESVHGGRSNRLYADGHVRRADARR
jgi:prepilin-type processing-associated H-X9-DG protein